MSVVLVCGTCKKEFSVRPYQAATRIWCSTKCKHEAHRVAKVCQCCGKDFWIFKAQERKGLGQFCSKECRDLNRMKPKPPKVEKKIVMKVCETCDQAFRVPPSRESTARFCSADCKWSNESFLMQMSKAQSGASGPYQNKDGYRRLTRFRNGQHASAYVHRNVMAKLLIESDPKHPFLILVDGKLRLSPGVVVHHINRDRDHNEPDNLLIVTFDAHNRIHHQGKKPEAWECWPPNPKKW